MVQQEFAQPLTSSSEIVHPRIYSATPPPKVTALLEAHPLPPEAVKGWFAVPILTPSNRLIPKSELLTTGLVDAYETILPLLGNPIFSSITQSDGFF